MNNEVMEKTVPVYIPHYLVAEICVSFYGTKPKMFTQLWKMVCVIQLKRSQGFIGQKYDFSVKKKRECRGQSLPTF